MKKLFLISILLFAIFSCEKDDFCTLNPVTPNLVLRFYNKDSITNLKQVSKLSIIAKSKTDSIYVNQTTDSIAIPLNSLSNKTEYVLKMNNDDGSINKNQLSNLSIKYTVKEEFISRSCGYRVIFDKVELSTSGWIDSLSSYTITTINNQSNAHVKVFH